MVLAVGVPLAAVTVSLPAAAAQVGYPLLQFAALAVAVAAVLRRRPAAVAGWMLILAGRGLWTAGNAYWNLADAGSGAPLHPSWLGALLLVQYPLFAAGLLRLARERGPVPAGIAVDAALITGAAAIGGWTAVIEPYFRSPGVTGPELAIAFGYVVLDLVLVAAVLRLVGLGGRPPAAAALLAAGAGAFVAADVSYAIGVVRSGHADLATGPATELLWLLWALAVAAAAWHPSAAAAPAAPRKPSAPDRQPTEVALSHRRLGLFAVLALLVPLAPVVVPGTPEAAVVPALLGAAVAVLLVVRLGMLAALLGRKSAALAYTRAQREALREELTHRAEHDSLTGLASRSALTEGLGAAGQPAALLLLDLDGFAAVNDAHGHVVGDELLVQVAARLRAALPGARLLARLGGDEFAALHDVAGAPDAAGRALHTLRPAYRIGGLDLHLTASAGLVESTVGRSAGEALRDADLALYEAKAAGRDRVVAFRPQLRDALVRRSELADGLRDALDRRELELAYQPVVDLMSGRMVAAEALLRWRRGGGEPVPPGQFVPIAEQTGLIVGIGWWALAEACARVRPWHERYGVAVTVNISALQLREPDFADRVLGALRAAGVPGAALVLEVTESTLITDAAAVEAVLQELRAHGVRVAVDDFGTGYSSLSYLMTLPVDVLKLDRAFTAPRGGPSPRQYAVVGAVLQLAAGLDLATIAEGVETRAQAQALRALGCPLAQGFLYSPPVPATAVDALLARWNPASTARTTL